MTKDEFLHKFQLNTLNLSAKQEHLLTQPEHLVQSAVLIALIADKTNQELAVLLTKRASHLKHHSGQICFPGGKVESNDLSFTATALREAHEEIGLTTADINVLGQLPPYQTITGFSITPIVALLDNNAAYTIDHNEVAEIFHVPFHHFLDTDKHHTIDVHHKTGNQQVHFMPYKHYNIWGATAAILKDLSKLVSS